MSRAYDSVTLSNGKDQTIVHWNGPPTDKTNKKVIKALEKWVGSKKGGTWTADLSTFKFSNSSPGTQWPGRADVGT